MEKVEYIALTFMVEREGEYFVSKCLELGTASFGRDEEEALEKLVDATEVYLNTLENLGECRKVFGKKGVQVYQYEPASLEIKRAKFPVGSKASFRTMPLHCASASA